MSTTYDEIPSILERVIGSDVIVIATVRGPVRVTPIEGIELPRVYGWFELTIRDTLSGDPPSETVIVRVVGEGPENEVTWPVPVPSEEPLLCFLTCDIGPDLPDHLYASCHNGVYTLSPDGVAQVPESALDDANAGAHRIWPRWVAHRGAAPRDRIRRPAPCRRDPRRRGERACRDPRRCSAEARGVSAVRGRRRRSVADNARWRPPDGSRVKVGPATSDVTADPPPPSPVRPLGRRLVVRPDRS